MPTVRFLGHSCFLVAGAGQRVLIDPFLTDNPKAASSADEVSCDQILLTHAHGDHFGDTIAIAKRTGATVIANFEIAAYCEKQGVSVHPMHIGGGHDFPFGRLQLTIAHHGSSFPDGTYGGSPAGLLIEIEGKKIHHAGDTALTHDMRLLADRGVDLAMLPIGDNFTMGPADAISAVDFIRPRAVVPMHFDTWPVIEQDAGAFARGVEAKGVRCHVLEPGQTIDV